ncbi:MAG: short-chain dehydrogenase of unknown substrate specificity [Methanohalophilus sp.]|jgi:hypothetical protein|nr:MAG: short-chain dehydrogenase of unknown substrate specificity [Methanohalophilus sp.]
MAQNEQKTVIITGGSSGIGLELAKLFAMDGYRLILVAQPRVELENARAYLQRLYPKTEILLKQIDLAKPLAANEVYAFTQERGLFVDVLVNCAGFGTFGFVNEIDLEKELSMLQLHVCTLYHITRLYLSDMIKNDRGYIINLSSISAFQPNPNMATYGASKSFVLNFSRALNYELNERKSSVKILAVCPTAVKGTAFKKTANMEGTNTFNTWMTTTATVVAQDTYKAMLCGKELLIPMRRFFIIHKIINMLPTKWLMNIARGQLKEKC